ncbi:sensor histidine kinase [Limosilactobacillus fastidiosus]|uniref:histidine kinase n=1 Tax=Limosilactobacillus fastidiosus TaxID=2759855 RepID=A0A7W3TZE3_9LACO|nr:HAMP domain-containing sensor histidine kinase [Limosilactobacillus fastidiosus]MBB1063283.1 HAMP domain-containing histidine kinase [Limosilactobacillus fastidiosus]MBB1086077.1 HAMP domain-containing histidine kinase [Limosilactobacillus fastidiosus]MCD7084593.1 HAMP domain-containing histidine kinase [Limosilactobacillus fastidiosus]MCD7084991.1 HAMP domain-containing histidine kinase [Limosilactobacillus fastidiosus]MCD7114503.1 HAMP domain-containing histidine kinase [Limosilactobacill
MKLLYRLMIAFFTVIITLMAVLSLAFINVTNETMYRNTWNQLKTYSDSLVQDAIRYDTVNRKFRGFENQALLSNAALLSNQHVHFAVFDVNQKQTFASNGFTPQISKSDWKKLSKGKTIYLRITRPQINVHNSDHSAMTEVIRPYFYRKKLIAVVSIATFVSVVEENMHQLKINLAVAFLIATLVALIISYIMARSITGRIDRLRVATRQVSKGNYQVKVPVNGKDEMDDLARSFNQMTTALRESDQEIRRQEERRRKFLADAAHEMRTPLTTINGLLEGLQYDAIPEEDRKHSLELMRNDTQRLIRLVNDNLDYEKIRTNQISMERKLFDCSAVLTNLKEQFAKRAGEKGDEIQLDVPEGLLVYADYDRFVQIMFNIIQNAIQFTDNGLIKVTARKVKHGCEFKISDNGIGMTDEQLKNIWERFYKADQSRSNSQYGESGLGLSIVHELVTLHGGKISVKSQPKKGTTFTLFFPDQHNAPHLNVQ